jgi:hypothetical protein
MVPNVSSAESILNAAVNAEDFVIFVSAMVFHGI